MKVCLLCGAPPNIHDAVGDFAWRLAEELARDNAVSFITPDNGEVSSGDIGAIPVYAISKGWGNRAFDETMEIIQRIKPDVILAHFVPQLYGWNGAKPVFAFLLAALKRKNYSIVTIAHEFSSPFGSTPKRFLLAAMHRVWLRMIVQASRRIILTNEPYAKIMKRMFKHRRDDIAHIPVGCALPVVPCGESRKQEVRERLQIQSDEIIVSTFGSPLEAIAARLEPLFTLLADERPSVRFLVIGKAGESLRRNLHNSSVLNRLIITGPISNAAASECMSISDLYLAFYLDGASTRRTSFMAGLAHALPTISNTGALTDSLLAASPALLLMNGEIKHQEVEAIRQLCQSVEMRRQMGQQGRALFDEHFSWARIREQYLQILCGAVAK